MGTFSVIEQKLHRFIRKYYYNELIKGGILFLTLGLLYLLFVLWVEDVLWLSPARRKILFGLFILVETGLLGYYIIRPLVLLSGIAKGLDETKASDIIGRHFPEIDDKLLNLLQLTQLNRQDELVAAGIEQKAAQLSPFPFRQAIQFSTNKKYLKYLLIPLLIWFVFFLAGKTGDLGKSYTRITHPQEVFLPPAPFEFIIQNDTVKVIEGNPFTLRVITRGKVIPEEVRLHAGEEVHYMKSDTAGAFYFRFPELSESFHFYLEGAGVRSRDYNVTVLPVPKIHKISMGLHFPAYLGRKDENINHTGNAVVPEGTTITWHVISYQTDRLEMIHDSVKKLFTRGDGALFTLTRRVRRAETYHIKASNRYVDGNEDLPFSLQVVKDEYPHIKVDSDIDSIPYGPAQFAGNISDDYGIRKVEMVYYPKKNPREKNKIRLSVRGSATLGKFFTEFPGNLSLPEGEDYELYFEVFDNDGVNGSKSAKSRIFRYHYDTETEIKQKILEEEKEKLADMQKNLEAQKQNRQKMEKLQQEWQEKSRLEYEDLQKLKDFIRRQQQYTNMMQKQTEKIEENLDRQPTTDNPMLEEKKEDIEKRIEEFKDLEKENKMLEELRKLAEKMQREELMDKIKKMSANNKQKEKSLEQLLELTKRFYVEQKQQQIIDRLNALADKQEKLSKSTDNNKQKQEKLNDEFKKIGKELEDLQKENQALKEPMDIDEHKPEQEDIRQEQQQATDKLSKNNKKGAGKNQQNAAQKMRRMAGDMQMQMNAMSREGIQEDIDSLRRIIDNLIIFSFDQEDLMLVFEDKGKDTPGYATKLKEQYKLKTFFEHIDDSLYVLAMRQPKLSEKINTPLADAHYFLDKSLSDLTEFRMTQGVNDQHRVMTAANDLALLLSLLLDNMQSSLGMGQGQGQGMGQGQGQGQGKGFQLPDIIQKQGELGDKMQQGMKPAGQQNSGNQDGEGEGENGKKDGQKGQGKGENGSNHSPEGQGGQGGNPSENEMRELYEIYKQQAMLRYALEKQLEDLQGEGIKKQGMQVKRQMEELEKMLLDKGITQDVMNRLRRIQHQLLKLKKAVNEQGLEQKRQSRPNRKKWKIQYPAQIEFKKKFFRENEILNRQPLPFKSRYRKLIQDYFHRNNLPNQSAP